MKKIISLFLVLIMTFSLAIPASAAMADGKKVPIIVLRGDGTDIYDKTGEKIVWPVSLGDEEGDQVDDNDGDHGEERGILEGVHEASVIEDLHIVAKAHPFSVLGGIEAAEGKIDALHEGPDEANEECHKGRQQEQPGEAPGGTADQSAFRLLFQRFFPLFL